MHFFKTKFVKLALMSIVLAFLVVAANQLDIFSVKVVLAGVIDANSIDTCGLAATKGGLFTKSGGTCEILAGKTTGLGVGQNLVLSNGAQITIKNGAELILAPGVQINLDSAGAKGNIIMQTGGDPLKGIRRGYLCAPDTDGDGYASGSFANYTFFATPCPALYVEKSTITVDDCNDASFSATNVCCTTGYRDYDKDGSGLKTDVSACYAPSALYNVVANNADCDDGNAAIYNGWSVTSFCGIGTCGGSGTDSCTNGTRTDSCVTSPKACCNAGVGTYKTAGTGISTCLKCTGSAADPINQTAAEDINNLCTTGGLGSGTSCRDANCSGAGDSCGSLANGTVCNYGSYTGYTGASGDCTLTSYRDIYQCSAGSCSGADAGNDYRANQNAPALGNIWNGSAWTAATCALNKGYGAAGQYCSSSAWNSTSQRLAYGCTTGGVSDTTSAQATCNQSTCSARQENNISCSGGNCVTPTNCADASDNDTDSYIDNADPGCGGGGQCTPGTSCCDANGFYLASGTVCLNDPWSSWTGTNGACTMSRSYTFHTCNTTGTCSAAVSGTNFDTPQNAPSEGKIVSANVWITATSAVNRGITSPYTCSGIATIVGSFVGCNTSGSTGTVAQGTVATGVTCSGIENNMCTAGNSACQNMCTTGGPDNDSDGYNDSQDSNCSGGYGRCTSGICCNASNGDWCPVNTYWNGSSCVAGQCSTGSYSAASGACQTSATTQYCSGASASCNGSTGTAYQNAPATNNIWNSSSWTTSNGSLYCGSGSYNACNGSNQPIKNTYGCNTSGSCGATANGGTIAAAACSGGSSSDCLNGSCVDCVSDAGCATDGYVAGTYYCSGANVLATWRDYYCTGSNTCASVDSPSSMFTTCHATNPVCSGGACGNSCPSGKYESGGSCVNCPVNTYKPGLDAPTSCVACPTGTNSGAGASACSCAASSGQGYTYPQTAYGYTNSMTKTSGPGSCTADRYCNPDGAPFQPLINDGCTCPAGYGVISNKVAPPTLDCRQCDPGTYSAGTNHATEISCSDCAGGRFGSISGLTTSSCSGNCTSGYYCPAGSTSPTEYACPLGTFSEAGSDSLADCIHCSAGSSGGYSWGPMTSGNSTTVYKNACYRSAGGVYSATGTCSNGVMSITGQSAIPSCYGGYVYTYGAWYQSTFGCYDVCVISTCFAGTTSGYTYPNISHGSAPLYGKSITNGSCTANLNCTDGTLYVQNESCGCNSGYTWNGSSCVGTTCGSGFYVSGSSCVICGAGTYKSGTNSATSCSQCSAGTYSAAGASSCSCCGIGSSSSAGASSCTNCAAGTYNAAGCTQPFCSACDTGYYCTGGSSKTACSAGYYRSTTGGSSSGSCTICSGGTYSSAGSSGCSSCTAGTYSSAGSSGCTSCSAGTYNSSGGQSTCSTCPPNSYCTGGANLTACSGGYTSPSGSTNSGACSQVTCPGGQYVSGTSCSSCSAGYYKSGTNAATSCSYCSAGTYNSSGGQSSCSTCSAGYYCTGGINNTYCGAGYTSLSGSTSSAACTLVPTSCGPGQYASGTSCLSCSQGSYKAGTNTATSCTACSAGTYNVGGGNSSCTSCPAGSYCTGGASLSSCLAGTYSTGGASSCTSCSAGTYNSSSGSTGCTTCPANSYCTGGSNLTACTATYTSPSGSTSSGSCVAPLTCGSGQYVNGGSCSSCSAGTYKSGTNTATSCSSCSGGTYQPMSGQSSCFTCTANYYCPSGSSNPTYCGSGYKSPAGSSSSGSCTYCGTSC